MSWQVVQAMRHFTRNWYWMSPTIIKYFETHNKVVKSRLRVIVIQWSQARRHCGLFIAKGRRRQLFAWDISRMLFTLTNSSYTYWKNDAELRQTTISRAYPNEMTCISRNAICSPTLQPQVLILTCFLCQYISRSGG